VVSGFIKGSENSTLGIGKDVRCDKDVTLERKQDKGWDGWNELMQSRKAEKGMSRREKDSYSMQASFSSKEARCGDENIKVDISK